MTRSRDNTLPSAAAVATVGGGRCGFTLVELLVCLAVIGVLTAISLPAVQRTRESARRLTCQNNLRSMGVAILNYESSHGALPPGIDFEAQRRHAWSTHILPEIEQPGLHARYDFDFPWNDPAPNARDSTNLAVSRSELPIYRCPSAFDERIGGIDYGGNMGSMLTGLPAGFDIGEAWEVGTLVAIHNQSGRDRNSPVTLGEVRDGAGHTLLVVECHGRTTEAGYWANGTNCVAVDDGINASEDQNSIASGHDRGAFVLFTDGHTAFLSDATNLTVLGRLAHRADGLPIGAF